MNFLNHAIRFQDEEIFPSRGFDDGTIITRPCNNLTPNRELPQQRREERIFADLAQLHC